MPDVAISWHRVAPISARKAMRPVPIYPIPFTVPSLEISIVPGDCHGPKGPRNDMETLRRSA